MSIRWLLPVLLFGTQGTPVPAPFLAAGHRHRLADKAERWLSRPVPSKADAELRRIRLAAHDELVALKPAEAYARMARIWQHARQSPTPTSVFRAIGSFEAVARDDRKLLNPYGPLAIAHAHLLLLLPEADGMEYRRAAMITDVGMMYDTTRMSWKMYDHVMPYMRSIAPETRAGMIVFSHWTGEVGGGRSLDRDFSRNFWRREHDKNPGSSIAAFSYAETLYRQSLETGDHATLEKILGIATRLEASRTNKSAAYARDIRDFVARAKRAPAFTKKRP